MKKRNKIQIGALLLAVSCLLATSACSSSTDDSSSAASSSSAAVSDTAATDQNTIYGKVTAVDGSEITLEVGTLNAGGKGQAPDGQGTSSGSDSSVQQTPPSQPDNASGAPADNASDTASGTDSGTKPDHQGGADNMLTLTGETKTITISDESIISKQQMGGDHEPKTASSGTESQSSEDISSQDESSSVTASLSDIQEGTILKITYQSDGTTLDSVVILNDGGSAKN